MGLVFLHLALDTADGEDPKPRLLDRWSHTPDYTEWTVHVREGLVWDDGVPVTAGDVKFGIELWTHPDVGYEGRFFDSITVVDSNTLKINYPDPPRYTIWSDFNWWAMVNPKHLLENLEPARIQEWPFWLEPVGNGPYRYVRHAPTIMTELEANPNYYGDSPKIPRIVLRYGGSGVTELLGGNVDIAEPVSALDAIRLGEDPRFRIYHDIGYAPVAIVWNHRNPLFGDVAVRRALTMLIDRRELHQVLNYPADVPIYDVPIHERHHVRGVAPDPLPFDPEEAVRLFASAGWEDTDGDGILDKEGRDFQFTLLTSGHTTEAVYVQDQFRRAGIRMEVGTYAGNVVGQRAREGEFDAAILARGLRIRNAGLPGLTGYENPELSRHTSAYAVSEIDQTAADMHAREIWRIVEADTPITYLHLDVRFRAAHRRVKGMQNNTEWRMEDLWIDDEGGPGGPSTLRQDS